MSVPNVFKTQTGPIPLQQLDDNFSAFQASGGGSLVSDQRTETGSQSFTLHQFNQKRTLFLQTDFGAKGDGTTDDTTAIQAALAASAGNILYAEPGTYIFSAPLQIPNNTGLLGAFSKSIFKIKSGSWSGASFPLPPITNADTSTGHDVFVRDIVLDGNFAGNPTPGAPGVLLSFRGTLTRYEVSRCIVQNYPGSADNGGGQIAGAPFGFGVTGGANAISDGLISDNRFLNNRGGALVIFGPRNEIRGNVHAAGATDAVFGAQGTVAKDNLFVGNKVKDCTIANQYSFYVEGASENTFVGNIADNSNGYAITDFNLAKPQRNMFYGNSFTNSPAGVPVLALVQTGVGLGASDNVFIHNLGPKVSTDPQYTISGTVGKNFVLFIDQGNAFMGFLDCVAATQKWIGTDTSGNLAFLNNAKNVIASLTESAIALKNTKPLQIEDSGGTVRAVLNMTAGNNLEIGGGMASGTVILPNLDLRHQLPPVAMGGGAAPTLGTIGGSGPATAAQNAWKRELDNNGVPYWIPIWK